MEAGIRPSVLCRTLDCCVERIARMAARVLGKQYLTKEIEKCHAKVVGIGSDRNLT